MEIWGNQACVGIKASFSKSEDTAIIFKETTIVLLKTSRLKSLQTKTREDVLCNKKYLIIFSAALAVLLLKYIIGMKLNVNNSKETHKKNHWELEKKNLKLTT